MISGTQSKSERERLLHYNKHVSSTKATQTLVNENQDSNTQILGGRAFIQQENVQYVLAKDTEEIGRLGTQHDMLNLSFGGNFEAPISVELEKGIAVLDSGCGPGDWTFDVAKDFPQSEFHGVDVSPVFPKNPKYKNCHFHLLNLNEPLPFPDNRFDYVHQRLLQAALTTEGWDKTISEIYRITKPGGWVELKEATLCDPSNRGTIIKRLARTYADFLISKDLHPFIAKELKSILEKHGFKDIKTRTVNIPLNHGGRNGLMHWKSTRNLLSSLSEKFRLFDPETYSHVNFDDLLEQAGKESAENEETLVWTVYVCRKPF